jgi:predicted permease
MPRGFAFPDRPEVWLPLSIPLTSASFEPFRQYVPSRTIGRLAPGATLERADERVRALFPADLPEGVAPRGTAGLVSPLRPTLVGDRRNALLVLLGATGAVLLLASANVANLLLSRGATRRRELAVRASLGATPARVLRQLLVESVVLAAIGGAVGAALAVLCVPFLDGLVPRALVGAAPIRLDARVFGFTIALSLATGMGFGTLPALRERRAAPGEWLKGGAAGDVGGARLRRAFVLGEVALAATLLIGSALMLRSMSVLLATDPGLRAERVATLELTLAGADFPDSHARRAFYRAVLERIEALPEVEAAGVINELPLRGEGGVRFLVYPEGRPPADAEIRHMAQDLRVTPGYFDALGIPLLLGRPPQARADTLARPEVAINRTLADLYWPGASPLGDRLEQPGGRTFEIVGVVADVRPGSLDQEPHAQMYRALLDTPYGNAALVARGRIPARRLAGMLEGAVRAVAPGQAVYNVRSMDQVISGTLAPRRTNTVLIVAFGVLALGLAAIGVFGVVAFSVARRTREIGIRIALGARPGQLRRAVLGEALTLALLGTASGVVGAWVLSRALSGLVYGITTRDPAAFTLGPAVLLVAAMLAALVPAQRATRVDPLRSIRSE